MSATVHISEAQRQWLEQHARAFGPEWLLRLMEREAPARRGFTRPVSPLVHRARAE